MTVTGAFTARGGITTTVSPSRRRRRPAMTPCTDDPPRTCRSSLSSISTRSRRATSRRWSRSTSAPRTPRACATLRLIHGRGRGVQRGLVQITPRSPSARRRVLGRRGRPSRGDVLSIDWVELQVPEVPRFRGFRGSAGSNAGQKPSAPKHGSNDVNPGTPEPRNPGTESGTSLALPSPARPGVRRENVETIAVSAIRAARGDCRLCTPYRYPEISSGFDRSAGASSGSAAIVTSSVSTSRTVTPGSRSCRRSIGPARSIDRIG